MQERRLWRQMTAWASGAPVLVLVDAQSAMYAPHLPLGAWCEDVWLVLRDTTAASVPGLENVPEERRLTLGPFADLHALAHKVGRFSLVVDLISQDAVFSRRAFKNLLPRIVEGGSFVIVRDADQRGDDERDAWDLVSHFVSGDDSALGASERTLARVIEDIESQGAVRRIVTKGHARWMPRDEAANDVLDLMAPGAWGKVLDRRQARSTELRVSLQTNAWPDRFPSTVTLPERFVREYNGAACRWGQVATLGETFLPDTFRRPLQHRLESPHIVNVGDNFGLVSPARKVRHVPGTAVWLDSSYPGHFGHYLTEVLSRISGFADAGVDLADVSIVLSAPSNSIKIPGYIHELLAALGLNPDRIIVVEPDDEVIVERLLCASPDFSQPYYFDPDLVELWARLATALVGDRQAHGGRIFLSRRDGAVRGCRNASLVEELFEARGFTVLYPEDYSFVEQAAIFAGATAIAGFAGSNLFGMIFARRGTPVFIVSGDSYTPINEYYIAAAKQLPIYYSFHDSDIRQPAGGWSAAAFKSQFTYSNERGRELIEALDQLG